MFVFLFWTLFRPYAVQGEELLEFISSRLKDDISSLLEKASIHRKLQRSFDRLCSLLVLDSKYEPLRYSGSLAVMNSTSDDDIIADIEKKVRENLYLKFDEIVLVGSTVSLVHLLIRSSMLSCGSFLNILRALSSLHGNESHSRNVGCCV